MSKRNRPVAALRERMSLVYYHVSNHMFSFDADMPRGVHGFARVEWPLQDVSPWRVDTLPNS